nr:PREDICTED: centromere-associated protein E isoform X2 [Lepisosteus oculatus]
MAGESAVKVCVRVRPLIQREEAEVSNVESVPIYWKTDQQTVYQVDGPKTFSFDRVFNVNESTSQVYDEVAKPLVISAIKGYNGTIFAYGQTSSGKTFTMMGSNESLGVIPLAIHDIFETIAQSQNMEFLLRVSYMEIYNETVTDLLVDSTKRKPLEIREGINRTVYVADLTEEVVVSASQVLEWIKKGEKNRHYGDTKMNQRSSRSHTIFRMILESRERSDPSSGEIADQAVMVSHLNLVDLAGSERASQTGAEGLRLKEGCNINRSLFTLGQVIKKLTDGNGGGFTNYRDSKLTRILQNSLGGNAKTVIICTITPATVEETLSTLQFASTAKHMKNDPHVNEVLDDGALMRRYRNEIVDLKRRLEEVSSETRMQATEKEVLAQLLQEKDQLQKEQEDRIRNLTKIVITSSSFAINDVKIRSKRRMTWGGKLLRGRQSEGFHFGDIGFLEHATKRKKSDLSALIEPDDTLDIEGEDVWQHNIEDFPFDVEMNMSNVSVRRSRVVQSTVSDVSASTPNSLSSQIQLSEVKERIAGLEEELQKKIRETWEAVEKQNAAEKRVSELEEALKAQDPRGEGSHVEGCREALCKMYEKDFRDTIQLCETLVAEKEELSAKLNLLKEELDALWKEKEGLQQEKVRLQQEIIEKEEQHEFNILEQEVHKQSETELAKEITSLKMELENSGVCIQNLKAELEAKSNELQNKEEWIAELENMGGKDLTEQIRNLKHSLGDAEAVSRDTKKEWAFLRSENLALKERENDMAARYKQMEVEVNQLRSQLESEKMRFKRMETDLQKELLMAFEENAKLNTLLDGKVPKNLIERLDLEKSVAELKKELEKSQEGERALQTEVNSLSALKNLPDKVDDLMKQVCDVSNELCVTRVERDDLLSAKVERDEEIQRLTEAVQQVTEDLRETQTKLSEADQKMANLSEQHSAVQAQYVEVAEDCEKLKTELESSSIEKQQCLNGMEDLKLQVLNVSEELQLVSSERDSLLFEKGDSTQRTEADLQELRTHVASLTQEREQLQEILESVRAEKSQLKADLEEKMVETQEELRQQQQLISDLKTQREERETQLEQQVNELSEQLKLVSSESETLLSERRDSTRRTEAELEELRTHITSLTQEREQLQETLESVRAEKSQLQAELEEKIHKLNEELKLMSSQHDTLLSESRNSTRRTGAELEELRTHITSLTQEREQLQETLESVRAEKSQLQADLEENISVAVETQAELCRAQDELRTQQELISDLKTQRTKRETQLDLKVNELSEQLQLVNSERDSLLLEKRDSTQRTESDLQELRTHIDSLTQEREQLQETLESVRAEKSQLNSLEDAVSKVSVFQQLVQGQERALEERDCSLAELQGKVAALAQERQQLRGSLEHLREQLESQTEQHQALIAEFELQSQASVSEDQRQSQRLKESEEQYQECLKRFQLQIDQFKSCAKNISALLNKDTTSQSKLVRQFVSSLPAEQSKSMLKLNSGISKINTDLVLRLRQQACVYSSIAEIHKDHFEAALQHSIASFEERKLHDLLIQRIQRASGSSSEHVSQQAQRVSDLLEERQRRVQEMTEILAELEDGLSCHATSRAQEHPIQEEINRTLKALCAAPTAGFVELEQVLQKENTRMTEKLQQTTRVLEGLKAKYYDIKERCQALLAKSTAELKEQRDRSQTLLVELDDGSPKKGSEVLQENLLLLERLEGSEKEIKTMQLKIKKLEGSLADAEAKAADRKRAADGMQMELQKLVAQVKERDESISTLRRSLSELEKRAEKGASPYIEELETLRSKLVKMEMERTGLLKKQEQTVAAMTAALEHRDESLRKLKETLRKSQQDQEASFVADEKPHTKAPVTCGGGSGIVQSTMMLMIKAEKAKLEAEVHQQKKKIGQMESVVSSLQAEASKWKGRARKLKETSGLKGSLSEMETLCDNQPNVSPRTPTKRRQVTSEGFILDSPKSKFFDSRSGSLSVACPKQFFDNSTLGTIPDVNPTAEPNSEGDWWSLAPQKDGAENCKTQ